MLNLHEDKQSKPSSWKPVGWIPHYKPDFDKRPKEGSESHKTRKNENFHACFRALHSEFSDLKPEAEVILWGDGMNCVKVFRLGGIIGDQQEVYRATSQGTMCHR